MTLMQLQACLAEMRVVPHLATAAEVQHTLLPCVTDEVQELSPHELAETICRVTRSGFADDAPLCDKLERVLGSPEFEAAAAAAAGVATTVAAAATPPPPPPPPPLPPVAEPQPAYRGQPRASPQQAAPSGAAAATATARRSTSATPATAAASGQRGQRADVMGAQEAAAVLQDKTRLRDELQRIFVYYSCATSLGAGGPSAAGEGLTAQRWARLCQDAGAVATHRHYAQPHHGGRGGWQAPGGLPSKQEADTVFAEAAAEARGGGAGGPPAPGGILDFDGLMVALRRLAGRGRSGQPPHEALHELLLTHVLPRALRAPEALLYPCMYNGGVDALLADTKTRRGLALLNAAYRGGGVELSSPQFLKLLTDFQVVPHLLSNQEAGQVYLSSKLDLADQALSEGGGGGRGGRGRSGGGGALLSDGLVRAAHVAFSKHPHAAKLPEAEHKVGEMLDRLCVGDLQTLRYTLDRVGVKVPQAALRTGTPPSKQQQQQQQQQARSAQAKHQEVALDDEEGMDRALRQVFEAYSANGNMGSGMFLRLCIDTKVAHRTQFNRNQVESTYDEARGSSETLTFDEWCDALLILGARRFPHLHQSEALRTLLTTCILPLAERRGS
eukprot:Rhum_TRINITY_DN14982_c9_g2::Rhum_TRINITY_DN14982_c9_g2_i1::g.131275::m.131275